MELNVVFEVEKLDAESPDEVEVDLARFNGAVTESVARNEDQEWVDDEEGMSGMADSVMVEDTLAVL